MSNRMILQAISLAALLTVVDAGAAFAQQKTAAQLLEEHQQRQRELAALRGQQQPPTPPVTGRCGPGYIDLLGVCSPTGAPRR